MRRSIKERLSLYSKVDDETTCINWTAYKDRDGYGTLTVNRRPLLAHRTAFQEYKGEIPQGMLVRHSCDNPSCINPDHLLLGTHQDNMKDKQLRQRIVGQKHPYSKLSVSDILEIRESSDSQSQLAEKYGVIQAHISRIKRKETWKHI